MVLGLPEEVRNRASNVLSLSKAWDYTVAVAPRGYSSSLSQFSADDIRRFCRERLNQ